MHFYDWDQGDIEHCIERSLLDAEHGRVALALARLVDIAGVFPNQASLLYSEGIIRSTFLGQGLAARVCFERAYVACGHDQADSYNRWIAACEITRFAHNVEDLRSWASIAQRDAPNEVERAGIGRILDELTKVETYQAMLQVCSQSQVERCEFGLAAAHLELALELGGLQPDQEVQLRRHRAQQLRNLDQKAHAFRNTIGELFPPDERLALRAALAEIARAIVLDPYDPEIWNLKSAWCVLLGQHETAIECTDRALALRPYNYPAIPNVNHIRAEAVEVSVPAGSS